MIIRTVIPYCILVLLSICSFKTSQVLLSDCDKKPILIDVGGRKQGELEYCFISGERIPVRWEKVKQPIDPWDDAGSIIGGLKFQNRDSLSLHCFLNQTIFSQLNREINDHYFNSRIVVALLFDKKGIIKDIRFCGRRLPEADQDIVVSSILKTNGMWSFIDPLTGNQDHLVLIVDYLY